MMLGLEADAHLSSLGARLPPQRWRFLEPLPVADFTGVLRAGEGPEVVDRSGACTGRFFALSELLVRGGEVLATRHLAVPSVPSAPLQPDPGVPTIVSADTLRAAPAAQPAHPPPAPTVDEAQLDAGFDGTSAAWEVLPEASALLVNPATPWCASTAPAAERAWSWPGEGAPSRLDHLEQGLRAQAREARLRRGLAPSDVAARLGRSPWAGGNALAEWELGKGELSDGVLDALIDLFELDRAELAALAAHERAAFDAAVAGWRARPFAPILRVEPDGPVYVAPVRARGDRAAVEAWARACAELTWRRVTLYRDATEVVTIAPTALAHRPTRDAPA